MSVPLSARNFFRRILNEAGNNVKMKITRLTAAVLLLCSVSCAAQPVMREAADGAGRSPSQKHVLTADQLSSITVILDAGHGFDDAGADSEFLGESSEKNITLKITEYLRDELTEKGMRVIMTHDGTSFPKTDADDGNNVFSPQERTAYSNSEEGELFISVHCDSYPSDNSVNGMRVYYSKGTKTAKTSAKVSQLLCEAVNLAFPDAKESAVRDMSKDEAYYVIRENKHPSALIEVGFITNEADAAKMLDDEWCKTLAEALSEGIYNYFAE